MVSPVATDFPSGFLPIRKAMLVVLGVVALGGTAQAQRTILAPVMGPDGRLIPGSGFTTNDSARQQWWATQHQMHNVINDRNPHLRDPYGNRYAGRNNVPQWVAPNGAIVGFPCRFCMPLH